MDKLKPENMEPWVQEEYERVFVKSTGLVVHEPKPAGQEDRKHFKVCAAGCCCCCSRRQAQPPDG